MPCAVQQGPGSGPIRAAGSRSSASWFGAASSGLSKPPAAPLAAALLTCCKHWCHTAINPQVLPLALSCALVLGRRSELFMRGHKLVEEYPGKAVAWFAVGAAASPCSGCCCLQTLAGGCVSATETRLDRRARSFLGLRDGIAIQMCSHALAHTHVQVGCYYMSTRQYDTARRYFSKATSLDPGFAPAWIAFGHAFSAQDERDQVGWQG